METIQGFLTYLFTNPLIFFITSNLIFTSAAGFTSPDSFIRITVFAIFSTYAWLCISNFPKYIQSTGLLAALLAASLVSVPLVYFDRLIYRKWKFEDRWAIFGTELTKSASGDRDEAYSVSEDQDTFSSRFAFGQEVAGTIRGPNTSWEVKNLPAFSTSDHQWIPSPTTFILWKSAVIISSFVLNDYVIDAKMSIDHDLMLPSKVPFLFRLGDVTLGECWTRLVVGLSTWLNLYFFIQLAFGCPALISVCFKPSGVALWRPVFGSLLDAYTMRGFWGKFWQQYIQHTIKGPAQFITYDVLQLPRTGIIQRYTLIFFVFFVSGCIHIASDMGASISPSQSGALQFFTTQVLGVMLEDGVQEIYRRARGGTTPALWSRVVGYAWVLAFLCWSTAVWQYPALLIMKKEDVVFRLSAFRSLGPPKYP